MSSDSLDTGLEFSVDDELGIPLASDPDLSVIQAWGVRHRGKQMAVPAVFVVDREGVVRYRQIGESITDRSSLEELLAAVEGL